jgi:hypothetical protein
MKRIQIQQLFISLALISAGQVFADDGIRTYHWTDTDGVMHYGDRVPPQYANNELVVLNNQGIAVDQIAGKKSDEQLADEAIQREVRAEQIRQRDEALLRDRVLLSTYLSIEEIEALRDRRIELVAGQMRVIQIYLDNLREKLLKLESEAQRFAPYNTKPKARPIDEKLARELSDTLDSIIQYENNLAKTSAEKDQLVTKFTADINRFGELHSNN